MKNLTLTLFFVFTIVSSTFAQAGNSLDARVATVTRNMATSLSLNESDYIKLKTLNHDNMVKAKEINTMYANDISTREMKISELQRDYETKLGTILNKRQMESYMAYKANKNNYTAFSAEEVK